MANGNRAKLGWVAATTISNSNNDTAACEITCEKWSISVRQTGVQKSIDRLRLTHSISATAPHHGKLQNHLSVINRSPHSRTLQLFLLPFIPFLLQYSIECFFSFKFSFAFLSLSPSVSFLSFSHSLSLILSRYFQDSYWASKSQMQHNHRMRSKIRSNKPIKIGNWLQQFCAKQRRR